MSRTTKTLLAIALAVALVAPATAFAVPGMGGHRRSPGVSPSTNATQKAFQDKRLAKLRDRIAVVLETRKSRFDAAVGRITGRIDAVSAIASQVEKAGGDVSAVTAALDKARSLVGDATAEEAQAVAMFKAVPDAANKRNAFRAARVQARLAASVLNQARLTLRGAVLTLRAVANGLKGAQG
jgi:hypothetical protein